MNWIRGFGLGSRVARRLFVLFLLASLIPVGGLAYFAYTEVSHLLTELNYRRLQQDAKASGMGLIQRLNWREQALKRLAERLTGREGSGGWMEIPSQIEGIQHLEIVGQEVLGELGPTQSEHLRRSGVVLRLTQGLEPFMLVAIPGSSRLIRARLEPASLWRDEEAADRYCILTAGGASLYCTADLAAPSGQWLASLAGQNSGVFPWQVGGEDHIAAYWRAGLQANYANDGFIVVVSEAKKDVLAILTRFRQTLPAIMVLALALAAWFSIAQIRRQMRPLERLEAGTRRLAQGDFGGRVEVKGNDEFASLAESFNHMAESLNHKFHLLRALGELDRAILAVSEMDRVAAMLLAHVPLAVPCDGAGILRRDPKGGNRLLTMDTEAPTLETVERICPEGSAMADWSDDRPWFALDLALPGNDCLRHFADKGATVALAFPVRAREHIESALILAYRQLPQDAGDMVQAGRSLADRLAAAESSIAWEGKLYRQAHYDALTDLPNRVMLRDRMEQALLRADREGLSVAAMLVDLDDFKQVNDSLGHNAGDRLLVLIAERLTSQARGTDTVARLAGDEFVVLITDLKKDSAISVVDRIASKISAELARPVDLSSRRVSAPASIGIALYPENAAGGEDLLIAADAAMYESKRNRRGGYRFYSASMNAAVRQHFDLAQELREAMDRKEFFLVYQPKVEAATGRVVGAEALVRWASPKRGLVPPMQFIHVIDEIGLQGRLGEWVLDTACAQVVAWDRMGYQSLSISVNVSPAQFHNGEIMVHVREALLRHGLDSRHLELEVLESMAVHDFAGTNSILAELREMGVGIALDDFGTGYSSLVYLTQLPANVLKIDRGFIIALLSGRRQQAIVEGIISLAKALDYVVVAEGVEEQAQVTMLAAMGCDLFQGYLFSRPLSAKDFVAFLDGAAAHTAIAELSRPQS
ncbi:MAG: EAL domain-containing protein [Sulfuritalea sp.]|nr:EAL domain-containing protein [Sulfuritalea sp.]